MVTEFKPRKPRLCIISYKALSQLIRGVLEEFADRAEIEVVEVVMDNALALGRELERHNRVDVIVSAGANAAILQAALALPVVSIQVSGYDVLQALQKARQTADRVGVVIYQHKIPELEAVKELLRVELTQRPYQTVEDMAECFRELKAEGYRVIIGSSLIVDMAHQAGIGGVLVYSLDSVRAAIAQALQIGQVAVAESARYDRLNAVLQHLHEAVLAVDTHKRIIAINPLMERILGLKPQEAIGAHLPEVAPELSLDAVFERNERDPDAVIQFRHSTFVANCIPIREQGMLTGALVTLQDAHAIQRADTNIRSQPRSRGPGARYRFEQIHGSCSAFQQSRAIAERYARTSTTVLITGESGTGKELFAQAMHNASPRKACPFVALNCAAFPEPLLESELFGYEEGAFTGSRRGGKPGLFETAHTGTVFLDEIGDMPVSLQTRLLRVLQEREVVRLGGVRPIAIDVRVVAATHRPLFELVERGLFRADLYYRLNILHLRLPPLRERREDIRGLALQLLYFCLRRLGCHMPADQAIAPLMPMLLAYHWPGNVRELENVVERFGVYLMQFPSVNEIDYQRFQAEVPELLAVRLAPSGSAPQTLAEMPELSEEGIKKALALARGNKGRAAELLGISRTTLWRKLREVPGELAEA
ncbi:Propionate catabolism operon regulatory protein [Burkholderiales bacterium]|nr:Propionate catabolism operon regulatory protein [Burkholderiales bacterium]